MIWRESLPARVAIATSALLAVILMTLTVSSYVITALLLRNAVDDALAATMMKPDFRMEEHDDDRDRPLPPPRPDDYGRLDRRGQLFVSLVEEDGKLVQRTGADWWQALTPAEGEIRALYMRSRGGNTIVARAPMENAHRVLPELLRSLILLSLLGVVLSGAIAWRMALQTYKPLKTVIATAEDIKAHSLALRVPDVWHDRTLRKLTGVLNAMFARLQSAFEAQSRFVAASAHELRGPLGAMRAELEVTLRRQRTPEEYRAALEGALSETNRLSAVAEHLLMLARGGTLARETAIPLGQLLERVAGEAQRSIGGEVAVDTPPDLTVDGDPLALERMVSNLVRNGLEAGGSPVTVTAHASAGGVEIQVSDHGPGIPAEALAHIFEPFFRADPARSRDGGTGLGLAIVKTVADAHGGRVQVASEPGRGSTFTVWLPSKIEA
ncbi:MAG TPA: HAMP domain-containing sensor histidine kinase [Symbiobacteriaceae bacterium]|nr:HAMP domain-containing sensor histidine kinase [Symbiobacteriaceae bacterium]